MSQEHCDVKETLVSCQNSQGLEIRAGVLRFTRHRVIFEVYTAAVVLRTSEVLSEFRIVLRERTVYSGRAVVRSLVSTGMVLICEVSLDEHSWIDVEFTAEMLQTGGLRNQFETFLRDWQTLYRILPDYKLIIADMQSYFAELRLWLDQVEIGIRSSPSGDRLQLERAVTEELTRPVIPCVNVLFEKFELVAQRLEEESLAAHRNYMRRQLHPLVLCAPFAHRAFYKPLGYAGDYELVNMMARNDHEGASLYAKVVNTWFLRQAPAEAHRNRIAYLTDVLHEETLRAGRPGRPARVFNVACGPARDVQKFIEQHASSDHTSLTLLDFNPETLTYLRSSVERVKARSGRRTEVEYVKKSVQQLLKESGRTIELPDDRRYDLVYCAGLFDYLSDQICQRLMDLMYDWVAPGGLVVATNVEPSNPLRHGMEHLLDWHLIYRTAAEVRALAPRRAPADETRVRSDATGVNVFLEVRKPVHA
jgi:extracellular factor (EF) 3-hydroxypalmitic acid methyl ester biosynthesis protein